MEKFKTAIALLDAVRATMDTISVTGIENQDKFVGCANAVQTVSKMLGQLLPEAESKAEKEEVNG